MQTKSDPDWVRIKDRIPYHGKGIDELVGALRRILATPGNQKTQKIVCEVGVPHIYIEKMVPKDEAGPEYVTVSLHDAIRTNRMDEFAHDDYDDLSPMQQLWEMFAQVRQEGFEVCAVAIGNKQAFQKWLDVRIPQNNMTVFGTPITIVGELPPDTFVICGASSRTAENEDIKYSMKGTV